MADVLDDLRSWLAQLVQDAPHRHGGLQDIEINLVKRAIEEIETIARRKEAIGST